MRWTSEQESMLVENAQKGAKFCRDEIAREFGVKRSVEATRRHANRLGVVTMVITICPHCGRPARKLNRRSGLCKTCNIKELAQKQREKNSVLLMQAKEIDEGRESEYVEAKREYDKERQANKRLRDRTKA